ncbi:metallophosphoesterase [Azorhizobium doebereinerae]|uniref:metallophosphoesterase n=1 Tax=Azorhizobium doebereinerae TaxID=281091 RepID=UPI000685BBA4|nr:metallophosphoesterase [Azorhizobium doebereinerae]
MQTFFHRLLVRPGPAEPPSRVPDGQVIYAIGDLHGRADLLDRAAAAIGADAARTPRLAPLTVFLGDYVDRGPGSAAIVERLASGAFPTPIVALKGNHEAVLLAALEDDATLVRWCGFGGLETLFSYGCDVRPVQLGRDLAATRAAFAAALPEAHRAWMAGLPLHFTAGDYFFCHAGIRPGVPLHAQAEQDLLWIRDDFLTSQARHERVIVHGHTPVMAADLQPYRINIDTGAFGTGRLTCLRLEGADRRVMALTMGGRAPQAR